MRPEHWLFTIPLRLRSLFCWARADQELDDELRDHLKRKTDEYVAKGMAAAEARRRARLELGGIEQTKEKCRDARHVNWIQDLIQDLRFGLRMLRKSPSFAAAAVLTLALGIGANVAIFSMVDALILKPLPVVRPSELISIGTFDSKTGKSRGIPSRFLSQLQNYDKAFTGIIADIPDGVSFRAGDTTERAIADAVTANYFDVLGIKPYLGRFFSERSDGAEWEPVAVLSYDFFKRRFATDPSVLGATVYLNGYPFTVVGVSPPGFFGMEVGSSWDVRVPMMLREGMQTKLMPAIKLLDPNNEDYVYPIGRLRPNTNRKQAEELTENLLEQLYLSDAPKHSQESHRSLKIRFADASRGFSNLRNQFSKPLLILMTCSAFVLLISSANVSNLLLVRAIGRQKESAIRLALGATRGRLVKQHLVEYVLLVGLGCLLGIALAAWATDFLVALLPQGSVPVILHLTPDLRVLGFAVGVSLIVAVVLAVWSSSSIAQQALAPTLKANTPWFGFDGPRASTGAIATTIQIALSVVLLVTGSLFLRTLHGLRTVNTGFSACNLVMLAMKPVQDGNVRYTPEQLTGLLFQSLEKIRAVPGVEGVSITAVGPFANLWRAHKVSTDLQNTVVLDYSGDIVTPGYFDLLGIPIVRGRDFTPADNKAAPPVAIITQAFAHDLFGDTDPIGHKISTGPNDQNLQVVGVIPDIRYNDLRDSFGRALFRPFAQLDHPNIFTLVIRSGTSDLAGLVAGVRRELNSLDNTIPTFDIRTASGQMNHQLFRERLLTALSSLYGVLALLLTLIGLFGIMTHLVSQRTQEIGVRLALGAERQDVLRLVIGHALKLTLTGLVIGLLSALALTRFVSSILYGVAATDAITLVIVLVSISVITVLGCYFPTRRAMRVDPMVALRHE